MNETRFDGHCGNCGKPVIRIANSLRETRRVDGVRFIYPNRRDTGYCIFRCDNCFALIDEVWREGVKADA